MKNYALLGLLLLSGSLLAQTSTPWLEKGEIQIGVGGGVNFGGQNGFSSRTAPYIQYFIKDRWAVRLEGQYEMYGLEGIRYQGVRRGRYIGTGLAMQYHFLKTDLLSLYGQTAYSYGQYQVNVIGASNPFSPLERTYRSNYGRFGVGLGAQYRLGNRWMINALVEQQTATKFDFKGGSTSVQLGVGFRLR